MKIKITAELAVPAEIRPLIGQVYEVVERDPSTKAPLMENAYFIRVGPYSAQVGVFPSECEVVEEDNP